MQASTLYTLTHQHPLNHRQLSQVDAKTSSCIFAYKASETGGIFLLTHIVNTSKPDTENINWSYFHHVQHKRKINIEDINPRDARLPRHVFVSFEKEVTDEENAIVKCIPGSKASIRDVASHLEPDSFPDHVPSLFNESMARLFTDGRICVNNLNCQNVTHTMQKHFTLR